MPLFFLIKPLVTVVTISNIQLVSDVIKKTEFQNKQKIKPFLTLWKDVRKSHSVASGVFLFDKN